MKNYTIYNSATTKSKLIKAVSVVQLRKMAMNGKITMTKRGFNIVFSGDVTDNVSSSKLDRSLLGTIVYDGKDVGWLWLAKRNYTINKDGTLTPLTKEKKAIIMGRRN